MTPRLFDQLPAHAGRTLFRCDDGSEVRYAEPLEMAGSSQFRDTHRRLVLCMCDNEAGGLAGYLALLGADAVPLMVGASATSATLERLLAAYRPAFAWLPQARVQEIPAGATLVSSMGHSLVATGLRQDHSIHDSLALLLGTSGSTGSAKFVRLSHENVLSNAQAIARYLELTPDDVPITTLPPTYTYGLSILHSHMLQGSAIALTKQTFFDRKFWDFLASTRATSFGGVPYHYEMLKKLRFANMELPALRTLTQAGGRMDPELARSFAAHAAERGIRFFIMYGQAEATARMSYLPPLKALGKPGSVGGPIPGGTFWLEDETGRVQEGPEASGQLVYQGRNVGLGYAHGWEDLARGDEWGGVLRTGDLARRDADGDYAIVGRLNRFLKLFGHRVNLQEVEQELQSGGCAAVCAGRDDHLDIYLDGAGAGAGAEGAKSAKTRAMSLLKVPATSIRVFRVDAVPRTESGKVSYAQLESGPKELLA